MSVLDALQNIGEKAARRLRATPKPIIRAMRRRARAAEHEQFHRVVAEVEAEIARVAASGGVIVAGPWLAEVGYEVLYWVPFLRWFCDAYAIPRERLAAVSRGGLEPLYAEVAAHYVDLFDLLSPQELAIRNTERRAEREGGGQKQSGAGVFDAELLDAARRRLGLGRVAVLHPSLMFRLFREVWHGNLPYDLLWRRTRHEVQLPSLPGLDWLPEEYVAAKFYVGPALSVSPASRATVRALVEKAARVSPVVVLDTDLKVDEHHDLDLHGISNVHFAGARMTPRDNLGLQLQLIRRARSCIGTCGGLAWLAPFLGVPTVAVYDNDHLLATHLFVTRQAVARAGAAEFATLDFRALDRIGGVARLP